MKIQVQKIKSISAVLLGQGLLSLLLVAGCASPESRAEKTIDTTTSTQADAAGTDTLTNTGSMSGSNGTGTDTTDTKRQKASRQEGNN
ncbi:hypothetical protein [Pedobacter sp. GR22-6]|uniref:hypothetical protein n=1 Tax=Pedobacter sp. GR22-6 TaxID=3127957 RepID=UPI00307E3C8D